MHPRNNTQMWIAILVTVIGLVGMAVVGMSQAAGSSDAIAPLATVPLSPDTASVQAPADAIPLPMSSMLATPTVGPGRTATAVPTALAKVSATWTVARSSAGTPTPVRVVVNTEKRSWVYYRGPATYVRADAFAPLALSSLPRPATDNGRGLHWFPTTFQTRDVVDCFVPELAAMNIRWVVVLQGMNDWDVVANDYLIERLIGEGMMPIMRIDRQVGPMDLQRLGWIVARYRERGVRYFQIFNEPNADDEWGVETPHSPERFALYWIQAAEVVAANGGLPGLAPVSPQKDDSDFAFFEGALDEVVRLGRFDLANLMWVSVHNYGGLDPSKPNDGFFRYRRYDPIVKKALGGSLPILITEGGLGDAEHMADVIAPMYQFMSKQREPYLVAFAPWLIGNAVGGGHDSRWESAAWFTGTLAHVIARPVVDRARMP